MRNVMLIAGTLALVGAAAFSRPMLQQQPGGGRMSRQPANSAPLDRWQPKKLPALPSGMTLDLIRQGDSVFHGPGGCFTCHGPEAAGMADKGSGLTLGLHFIPQEWHAIDSLVTVGIPEALTRTSIAMPPRGATSSLTPDQVRQVAAYVWAISQTAGEPWPGGHKSH